MVDRSGHQGAATEHSLIFSMVFRLGPIWDTTSQPSETGVRFLRRTPEIQQPWGKVPAYGVSGGSLEFLALGRPAQNQSNAVGTPLAHQTKDEPLS